MFVNFSEETRHLLKQAEKERDELNHPYVGSEHLFLSILKDGKYSDILKKHKLTYSKFKNKLISIVGKGSKKSDFVLYTPLLKKILENSVIEAREESNQNVNPEMLIISMLDEEDGVAYSILRMLNINIDKLYFDIRNKNNIRPRKHKRLLLDELGTNLIKLAHEKRLDPVIGRDKEISKTVEILLRRKKNNPILIGPAGVGKTAIVEGIANMIANSKCPTFLKNKKIISLNIFSLVSGTKYRGEFEEKMKTLIKELEENDDIILFIDEIHTMVGAGGAEGAIDASNIFKPALARGNIRIIGATTSDEYKKFIEPDAALARRFQCVNVNEPNFDDVVKILTEIKPLYEKFHNICIPKDLILDIVKLSDKYLLNRFEPDRSIDILDEVCAKVSVKVTEEEKRKVALKNKLEKLKKLKMKALSKDDFKLACDLKKEENKILRNLNNVIIKKKTVTIKDVLDVIKEKSNVLLVNVNDERKAFYKKIKDVLNNNIIGQESNINKIIESLKIKDISKKKKCYSILITGEHSTGKTLLAQSYLELLIPKNNIIKIDLSEYKEYHTISKLVGTTAGYLGYDNKSHVFEKVRNNPSSALIVDNFNLGCEDVKYLFARILENGYIEDGSGNKIDFTNTIIIFTCVTEQDAKTVGFNNKYDEYYNNELSQIINKVSLKISIKKLSDNDLKLIIDKKINEVFKNYKDMNINIDVSYKNLIFDVIKSQNGIKKIDETVTKYVETKIIEAVLNGKKSISLLGKKQVVK